MHFSFTNFIILGFRNWSLLPKNKHYDASVCKIFSTVPTQQCMLKKDWNQWASVSCWFPWTWIFLSCKQTLYICHRFDSALQCPTDVPSTHLPGLLGLQTLLPTATNAGLVTQLALFPHKPDSSDKPIRLYFDGRIHYWSNIWDL